MKWAGTFACLQVFGVSLEKRLYFSFSSRFPQIHMVRVAAEAFLRFHSDLLVVPI